MANLKWKPISTLKPEDDAEYIVGWDSATVWITRSAWYNNGEPDECDIGWWSYKHSVTQECINPTHWLCETPIPPEIEY